MNKKGVGIIFNWLFAIIVGVSIFLLLVGFAVKNTDLFGKVTGQEVVELLDIAFTDFKSNSIGTRISFDDTVELDFTCRDSKEEVRINGKGIEGGTRLKGNIVFAPENMKSVEYSLWSVPWRVPFRVTNFIFLTDRNYNLVNVPSKITDAIPIVDGRPLFEIDDSNGEIVEFVSGSEVGSCGSGKKISYVQDLKLDEFHGELCVDGRARKYVGTAMIYAYIFSDMSEFICLKELSDAKAEVVKGIYIQKLSIMNNFGRTCDSFSLRTLNFDNVGSVKNVIDDNEQLVKGRCGRLLF